jgi:hypothetical protein
VKQEWDLGQVREEGNTVELKSVFFGSLLFALVIRYRNVQNLRAFFLDPDLAGRGIFFGLAGSGKLSPDPTFHNITVV